MVLRKRILLEALKASVPDNPRAPKPDPAARSTAGGPFATTGPASRDASAPGDTPAPRDAQAERDAKLAPRSELHPRPSSARSARGVRWMLVLVPVAIAVAFWYGRESGRDVAAGGPIASDASQPSGPGALVRGESPGARVRADSNATPTGNSTSKPDAEDLARKNQLTAKSGTSHDQAFMDPKNRFTVRLVQYKNDDAGLAAARATAEHLRKQEGLPVVGPIVQGNILLVCAGYAPNKAELDPLIAYVHELRGPPPNNKTKPFADAYLVNIDDVVRR